MALTSPLQESQKTQQVGNSHEVTDHNYLRVVFTVKVGIHFRRQPEGRLSFTHTHSYRLSRSGHVAQVLGVAGSCQVLYREEHDHAGEQHPTYHKVLVLEGPLLNEPHHCVGQAQHVGNVKDLLLSPLGRTRRERVTKIIFALPRVGECHYEIGLY